MFWASKLLAPAVLVAGLAGAAAVLAQPPERRGNPDDKKAERPQPERKANPDDKRGPEPGPRPMGDPHPRPDASVEAWVKVLIEKIADPHDTIRDSARAALVHVGPQALPALRQLADGADNIKATAARNVIGMIGRQPGGAGGLVGPGPGPGRDPLVGGPGRPGGPGERPAGPGPNPVARAIGELKLTEEQGDKVRAIIDSHGKKMQEIGEQVRSGKLDPMDAREGLEKLRADLFKGLKGVLTEEQFQRLEAALEGPRGRPGEGDRPPPPGERPPGVVRPTNPGRE